VLVNRIPTILKTLVLVLVLANGVYWAYTQGWGATWGWGPANPSEPQRLKAQVQPAALKVVSAVPVNDGIPVVPPASAPATTPAQESAAPTTQRPEPINPEPTALPSPTPPLAVNTLPKPEPLACMQSQVLPKARAASVRQQLEGLAAVPKTSWSWVSDTEPERWIIYLGRFASEDALERKAAQLEKMELKFVVLDDADLSPGISVGMFKSQAEATQELNQLNRRGLRLARVIKWMNAYKGQRVVMAAMNPDWRKPLEDLGLKLSECP